MNPPKPTPSRPIRILRKLLFITATLVTVVALLLAEEHWRGAHAWQQFQRESEARGERFDIARLLPAKVPDDQNFMMTPFLAPLFNLPPEVLNAPITYRTNIVDGQPTLQMFGITNKGTNLGGYIPQYTTPRREPTSWTVGQVDDLLPIARACLSSNSTIRPEEITDPKQASTIILDHLSPCEGILAEIRRDTARPFSQPVFPWESWNNPHVNSAVMQQLACMKGLAAVTSLDARCALVLGDADRAFQDTQILFRLGQGLDSEPIEIAQLVRFANLNIALVAIGQGLAEQRWSAVQLQDFQSHLQQMDLISAAMRGIYGERDICGLPGFEEEMGRTLPGWAKFEEVNYARAFGDFVLPRFDASNRVVSPSVNRNLDEAFHQAHPGGIKSMLRHDIMATMTMPAYQRFAIKLAEAQTGADLALIACALERYRLAENNYPQDLDALVPKYLGSLPHDVINGQPLHYHLTGDGKFVLYSVGWNEKDDGGKVASTPGATPHADQEHGDWVWPQY